MKAFGVFFVLIQLWTVTALVGCKEKQAGEAFTKTEVLPKYWDKMSPAQKEFYKNMNPGQKTSLEAYPNTLEQWEAFLKIWRRHTGQKD